MGRPSKASRASARERRREWQNSSYLPSMRVMAPEPEPEPHHLHGESPMNHAIIIILAHGCINATGDPIDVPECVVDFEKKKCNFVRIFINVGFIW